YWSMPRTVNWMPSYAWATSSSGLISMASRDAPTTCSAAVVLNPPTTTVTRYVPAAVLPQALPSHAPSPSMENDAFLVTSPVTLPNRSTPLTVNGSSSPAATSPGSGEALMAAMAAGPMVTGTEALTVPNDADTVCGPTLVAPHAFWTQSPSG